MKAAKLLSDGQFLKVAQRASLLSSRLLSIEYDDAYLIFKTESGTTKGVFWTQKILLQDLADHIKLMNYKEGASSGRDFFTRAHEAEIKAGRLWTTKTASKALQESHIRCSCDCPADLYWGFRYIRWKNHSGMIKELRKPRVRNPYQQGFVCKHLYSVLTLYPYVAKVVERLLIRKGFIKDEYIKEIK